MLYELKTTLFYLKKFEPDPIEFVLIIKIIDFSKRVQAVSKRDIGVFILGVRISSFLSLSTIVAPLETAFFRL